VRKPILEYINAFQFTVWFVPSKHGRKQMHHDHRV